MNKTGIEYLTHTWSPLAMRCTPVSPGCANCWHLAIADRLAKNPKMPEESRKAYLGEIPPVLKKKELFAPFKKKEPAIIGVQFMGDLFHNTVTFQQFSHIMFEIEKSTQHIFIILTKRPERMLEFIKLFNSVYAKVPAPLQNLCLGVSIEDQNNLDYRLSYLLHCGHEDGKF